jgi:hypothetical protein
LPDTHATILGPPIFDPLSNAAFHAIRQDHLNRKRSVGDVVLDYRHYIHRIAPFAPHLEPFADFFEKEGKSYTSSTIYVVDYARKGDPLDVASESGESQGRESLSSADEAQENTKTRHAFDKPMQFLEFMESSHDPGLELRFIISEVSQTSLAVLGSSLSLDVGFFDGHVNFGAQTSEIMVGRLPSHDYHRIPFGSNAADVGLFSIATTRQDRVITGKD